MQLCLTKATTEETDANASLLYLLHFAQSWVNAWLLRLVPLPATSRTLCVYIYMIVYVNICVHDICIYLYMCTHFCTDIYTPMHTHTHVYVYVYEQTHTYTYKYFVYTNVIYRCACVNARAIDTGASRVHCVTFLVAPRSP